tara:strand:+ start:46 stop:519 length:474 start_codon:yes stop_codon:yes gene_type:complete
MIAIEANAAAAVSSLEAFQTPRLWSENEHIPGWLSGDVRKLEAEDDLIRLLRAETKLPGSGLGIRTMSLLRQVKEYDGTQRKRRVSSKGVTRHFDRAITALIAANIFKQVRFERKHEPDEIVPSRAPKLNDLARKFRIKGGRSQALLSPHRPPDRSR